MKISCRVRGDWFHVPCADGNQIIYHKHEFIGLGGIQQLKTVAFISGKKNPATQKKIIRFSIEIKL